MFPFQFLALKAFWKEIHAQKETFCLKRGAALSSKALMRPRPMVAAMGYEKLTHLAPRLPTSNEGTGFARAYRLPDTCKHANSTPYRVSVAPLEKTKNKRLARDEGDEGQEDQGEVGEALVDGLFHTAPFTWHEGADVLKATEKPAS